MNDESFDYWDASVFIHRASANPDHLPAIERTLGRYAPGERRIATSALTLAEVAFTSSEIARDARNEVQFAPSAEQEQRIERMLSNAAEVRIVPVDEAIGRRARTLVRLALGEGRRLDPPRRGPPRHRRSGRRERRLYLRRQAGCLGANAGYGDREAGVIPA